MALKFSPGFEVQHPVIKQVSSVLHTGDRWETIWYWAVTSTKGLETMRLPGGHGAGQKAQQVMGKGIHGEYKEK